MHLSHSLPVLALSLLVCSLGIWLARERWLRARLSRELEAQKLQLRAKDVLIEEKQERLEGLLEIEPLRREMLAFRHVMSEGFGEERKEVYALRQTIESLLIMQNAMNNTAKGLADALRGNSKIRGNWGEMVLERVLESAGMQEGRDFVREGRGLNLGSDSGRRYRPDVVVLLPRERHLVIDAKLNLVSYERFVTSRQEQGDGSDSEACWREFMVALKAQVDGLAQKNYTDLKGLTSPDFVFLFIPIESAFADLMEKARWVFDESARKNILLCSPLNLMAGLKLVSHLWSEDRRNRHADELAARAGKLYEKFRLCLEDIRSLGTALEQAAQLQSRTLSRWTGGRESVAWQFDQLRKMGVPVKTGLGLAPDRPEEFCAADVTHSEALSEQRV